MLSRLALALTEFGFQNFGGILALGTSVALWICAVWAGWVVRGVRPPSAVLLALPLVYVINVVMLRLDRRWRLPATPSRFQTLARSGLRLWAGCSFAALFSAATLAAIGIVWGVAATWLDTLVVQAGTLGSASPETATESIDPLFRWIGTLGMTGAAFAIAYGYTAGQRRLGVTRLTLPVRRLPAALEGFRIVQISDVHVGPYLSVEQLGRYVRGVNALHPDLIVITGDIVDQRLADLTPALPTLAGLRARYGVVAILGNHDHRVGADAIAERLAEGTDFILLRDGRFTVRTSSGRLHVVGIEDRGGAIRRGAHEEQRLEALLREIPAGEPVVLLAHRPELFGRAAAKGVALTLSGHTHGGQIALTLGRGRVISPGSLMSRFTRGLFEHHGSYLYVNRGLGVVGQPVRLGSMREITLFELFRRSAAWEPRTAA